MLEPCTHPKTKPTQIWNDKTEEWEDARVCVICQCIVEEPDSAEAKGQSDG